MATDPGLSFFLVVGRYLSHRPWHDLKNFSGAKDRHPTEGKYVRPHCRDMALDDFEILLISKVNEVLKTLGNGRRE